MGHVSEVSREQLTLFAERLEELVPADASVRLIDRFVDGLPLLSLGFSRAVPAATGRPGYSPSALLKLYLYGYMHDVRSSRRLERETHRNVEVMWLLGRQQPDFKTVARFRAENGEGLQRVCGAFVSLCLEAGLASGRRVSLDGTKVAGQNARHRVFGKKQLERKVAAVDEAIASYLRRLDEADASEAETEVSAEAVRLALAALEEKRAKWLGLLSGMEPEQTQVALTDADAQRMKTGQGDWVVGYNVQVVVDTETHLVVHHDLAQTGNDRQSLAPMATATQAVLGEGPLEVLADRGYSNGAQGNECEALGIEVTAPRQGGPTGKGYSREQFVYDAEQDSYQCPAGETLHHVGTTRDGERTYRTRACQRCALRPQCTTSDYRSVSRQAHEDMLAKMDARARASDEPMLTRKTTVEPVIGTLKRYLGGRFLTRGRFKVKTELALAVLSYNFRRLLNLMGKAWFEARLA